MIEVLPKEIILENLINLQDCSSLEEGKDIAVELFKHLAAQKTAPSISANQVGINKRVIALNVREPLFFINPVINSIDYLVPYLESCITHPQKLFSTVRGARIQLSALNLTAPIYIGIKPQQSSLLFSNGKINVSTILHPVIMEAAMIQQSIGILSGKFPEDFTIPENNPIYKEKQPDRNKIITLFKDEKEIEIKFKKIDKFLNDGWKIKK